MKQFFLSMIMICVFGLFTQAQKTIKTNIFTLQANEQLVYGENCFNIGTGAKNTLVFTSKSSGGKVQYFMYDNGVKKGPFNDVKEDMVKCSGAGIYTKNCARLANSADANEYMNKYITVNQDDGKSTINFNGVTYGPYYGVSHFFVTKDNTKFYAVVMNVATMSSDFICSDGKTVAVGGSVISLYVSPDGNDASVFQKGLINMEELMKSGGDISKINLGDLDKVLIVNISGKKTGPLDNLESNDVWYCKTNNSLIYHIGNDVYKDGNKFITLNENPEPCNLWISKDSKRYAIVSYDKILFNDGESYPYPIEIECISENNKMYLSWIALENETNLVLYKKEF